jgi:hypothetical protein
LYRLEGTPFRHTNHFHVVADRQQHGLACPLAKLIQYIRADIHQCIARGRVLPEVQQLGAKPVTGIRVLYHAPSIGQRTQHPKNEAPVCLQIDGQLGHRGARPIGHGIEYIDCSIYSGNPIAVWLTQDDASLVVERRKNDCNALERVRDIGV